MGDLFSPGHILLILLVILLLFGPKKLPELGHALGRTLKSFKDGARSIVSDDDEPSSPAKPAVRVEQAQDRHVDEAPKS